MKQVCKTKKKYEKRLYICLNFFMGDVGFALAAFHDVSNRFEIISDCCFVVAISIFYYFLYQLTEI